VKNGNGTTGGLVLGMACLWLTFGGCASEPPKAAPTVTPDQTRGHADKTFQHLKQEERDRGANAPVTP